MEVVSFPAATVMGSGSGRAMNTCLMHLNFLIIAEAWHFVCGVVVGVVYGSWVLVQEISEQE